jgi:hypothetical protein
MTPPPPPPPPPPLDRTQPGDPTAALLQQLRDMKEREAETPAIQSRSARRQWIRSVAALLDEIRSWLAPAVEEHLAALGSTSVHLADDDVGAYEAPALEIRLPGERTIWVRPVGTLRVGGQGIVDLVCGSNRALLVLNAASVWKIRGPGVTSSLVTLDVHTFTRAVSELLL